MPLLFPGVTARGQGFDGVVRAGWSSTGHGSLLLGHGVVRAGAGGTVRAGNEVTWRSCCARDTLKRAQRVLEKEAEG